MVRRHESQCLTLKINHSQRHFNHERKKVYKALENGTQNTNKMMNVASYMRPKQGDNEMSPQGSMKHKRKG